MQTMMWSRRHVLGAGAGAVIGASALGQGADKLLPLTADQDLGPFYPVIRPLDHDADLTRVAGMRGIARGEIIEISGRVLDPRGRPVAKARIDLWQANALGRYAHPGDNRDVPLDPNFQGAAVIEADAAGRYRFRTIKPGFYPIGGGMFRTPHIHLDVTGRSQRLTTQLYFPGEPLNAADILFPKDKGAQDSLLIAATGTLASDPAVRTFAWDIVLLTS